MNKIRHNRIQLRPLYVVSLLVGLLILGVFTRCTSKPPVLSIKFVQSWADDVNPAFQQLAQRWAKDKNIQLDIEIVPIKDLGLKSTAWLQSPSGDLALLPTNLAMVNTNKLRDLTPLAEQISQANNGFYDIGQQMAQLKGHWYNIPFCAWPHVWFYRKDLLDKLHASIPTFLIEASALAKRLTDTKQQFYGLGIGLGQDEDFSMFLQTLLWAFGGKVVESDGHTVALNSPETLATVNYIMDLYRSGAIPPGALGWDDATNNNLYLGKKIAITANALSIDYVAKRKDPELFNNTVHSAYPAGPAGRFAFVQTFGWAIKQNSPHADLAEDFLKYLYNNDNLTNLFNIGEGAIAPLSRATGSGNLWQAGRYKDAIESVERAKALGWPGPFTPAAAEIFNRRIINNIFARIINDHLSPDAAVTEAAAKVKEIYSR